MSNNNSERVVRRGRVFPEITAQGEAFFDIYLGRVRIDGQEYEIPVFAGEAIQEILLGSRWLKQFILVANYQQTQVTLG